MASGGRPCTLVRTWPLCKRKQATVRYPTAKARTRTHEAVIDMISQIGYVGEDQLNAIAEARNAYNKLSAADKAKVENYNTLTAAETSYKAILKQRSGQNSTRLLKTL